MADKRWPSAPVTPAKIEVHPVIQRLQSSRDADVVVLGGPGISSSAGITNDQSSSSGTLKTEDVSFSLDDFKIDPVQFAALAKKLWHAADKGPSLAHRFVRLLELKGLLRRHYSYNMDGLDRLAGISNECLIEMRGSFREGKCLECGESFDSEFLRKSIFASHKVLQCKCGGLIKPGIAFKGEPFAGRFYTCSSKDFGQCRLVVCLGTSLKMEPFARLISQVPSYVPRLLIDCDVPSGWASRPGDLVLTGSCDEHIAQLAQTLDWADELHEIGRPTRTLHSRSGLLTDMLVVTKDALEGRWCNRSGDPVADIVNSTIIWPQSPWLSTELRTGKKNRLIMELQDRLYYAKVSSGGSKLQWSDGAVWYRASKLPAHKGCRSSESSVSETRATETSSTRTVSTPTSQNYGNGDDPPFEVVTDKMLEGEWSTADGEPVASIARSVISWPSDPSIFTRVSITKWNSLTMELEGKLYTGKLTASHARIKWCDGEVWHRVWKPFYNAPSEDSITCAGGCHLDVAEVH